MIGENFFKIKSLTNLNVGSCNRNFGRVKAIGMGGVAVEETLEQDIGSWERGDKGKRKEGVTMCLR